MRLNVIHNGKHLNKGDMCPKELEKDFLLQGLLEEHLVPVKEVEEKEVKKSKEK